MEGWIIIALIGFAIFAWGKSSGKKEGYKEGNRAGSKKGYHVGKKHGKRQKTNSNSGCILMLLIFIGLFSLLITSI